MLEAVTGGNGIPRKALRKLKIDSIEEYAKTVAANLSGEFSTLPGLSQALFTHSRLLISFSSAFTSA